MFTLGNGYSNVLANYNADTPRIITQTVWGGFSLIYLGIFAWQWSLAVEEGNMFGLMSMSIIANFALMVIFIILLFFIPSAGLFADHVANKSRFDIDLLYFWSATILSIVSMGAQVMFVSHNTVFEIWGKTGVPRDMLAYRTIIYVTGLCDFI